MKLNKLFIVFCLMFAFGSGAVSTSAFAGALEDAKAAGFIGEKSDGYLGVVSSSAPSAAVNLANEINLKRRAKYREIAEKNNTNLKSVEAVVGQKLTKRAKPGEFVSGADGRWIKK